MTGVAVAVVGTGSAGRRHLANLVRLGRGPVVAVSEHSRRDTLLVEDTSIPVVHNVTEVLADVDAVVVANPTNMHAEYLELAIAARKHVLCEKPASTSADGVAELAIAAAEADVVAAVACQFRFNEMLATLRSRVLAGSVGTVLDVDAMLGEHLADYHPDEDYRTSYAARRSMGGGVLLTQIHQIDFLSWIFGPFESAFAIGGQRGDLAIDVEDSVSYLLASTSGVPVRGHLDYLQRPKRLDLVVTGTEGRLEWEYHANRLRSFDSANDTQPETLEAPFDRNRMFLDLLADFLDAVTTGSSPRTTLADAARVLEVVDTIRRSMESGVSVPVRAHREATRP